MEIRKQTAEVRRITLSDTEGERVSEKAKTTKKKAKAEEQEKPFREKRTVTKGDSLMPCPFCAGEARVVRLRVGGITSFSIECACTKKVEHSISYIFDTAKEAQAWWNKRRTEHD